MILLSALHDPNGTFATHIANLGIEFYKLFTSIYILHTENTSLDTLTSLSVSTNKLVGGSYSASKLDGVNKAVSQYPNETYFYCDFDKVLLWNQKYPDEFKMFANKTLTENYHIVGRSSKAFTTYPISWIDTENITNKILSDQLKVEVEALTATCIFDSQAAKIIRERAQGKEWESPVEWPLLVHQNGLKVGFETAEGLVWEDPYFYFDKLKCGSQLKWRDEIYNSPQEWTKRINASYQQVSCIADLCNG